MTRLKGRLLLYAPNVHTGGGFVLIQSLLAAWPVDHPLLAWLDDRARSHLKIPDTAQVRWVRPSIASRISAELELGRAACREDRVFCFHSLPPLRRLTAEVWVFQQNRNYLDQISLAAFGWKTRYRLRYERLVGRLFRHRVTRYWVQTPSMARAVRDWYGSEPPAISVLPFVPSMLPQKSHFSDQWDFVYVGDGEAHKNHRNLVNAWILLSEQGLRPSLAITLSARDHELKKWVDEQVRLYKLQISDLGSMDHPRVLALYNQARALIFPSKSESFGLPLVEACNAGLPILAGELDFVRDVCSPVQSFDPNSPVSIARAVRRYLGRAETPLEPLTADAFLRGLLRELV
jgi:glycosyltransferase involved in cell wall biosynthesis